MDVDDFIKQVLGSPTSDAFFHFTDAANLPSIQAVGLLSMSELRRRKIEVPAPGGNQWSHDADMASGMDQYVHLALKVGHPMEKAAIDAGRIKVLKHVRVRPSILKIPSVMGTLDVSNKAGVAAVSLLEFIKNLDHQVLYTKTNWNDAVIQERLKRAEKCELLIPKEVALDYLTIP